MKDACPSGRQPDNEITSDAIAKGVSPLRSFASAAAASIYDAISAADTVEQLDPLARTLWRSYCEGAIYDDDAQFLQSCLDRRRPLGRATAPGYAKPVAKLARRVGCRFTPRQRPRSPDRKASRDRRRMFGGAGALPPDLRSYYTEGQRSVLAIIAGEVKRHGICDLKIDAIAAIAGVCATTVQTTLHEARRLLHLKITERPQPGRKNLSNLVEIISAEWVRWLKRGPTTHRPIGSNSVKMVSTTKITDVGSNGVLEKMRAQCARTGRDGLFKGATPEVKCGA